MQLSERIAQEMRKGLSAAEAAEVAEREAREEAERRAGPIEVKLNLKPVHQTWLLAKCEAYGITVEAFLRKAVAEMWQVDEWRRTGGALEKGDPATTMPRNAFKEANE